MKRVKKVVSGVILMLALSFLLFEGLIQASNLNNNTSGGAPALKAPKIKKRGWHESHR